MNNNHITKTIIPVIIIFLVSISFSPIIQGQNILNNQRQFYFQKYINNDESIEYESNGLIPLISDNPPMTLADRYYPPKIKNSLFSDDSEYLMWLTFFSFLFIDDYLDDYYFDDDFWDSLKILLPNPLALTECYEHNNSNPIEFNGNAQFQIFIDSPLRNRFFLHDRVEVSLYKMEKNDFLPNLIGKTSTQIVPSIFFKIKKQIISMNIEPFTVQSNETLIFSIKIIPENRSMVKTLVDDESMLHSIVQNISKVIVEKLSQLGNPNIQDLLNYVQELHDIFESLNITKKQKESIGNILLSPKIAFDSLIHPSSVELVLSPTKEV